MVLLNVYISRLMDGSTQRELKLKLSNCSCTEDLMLVVYMNQTKLHLSLPDFNNNIHFLNYMTNLLGGVGMGYKY